MAELNKIAAALEEIAPPHLAEDWDNSGFQIRISDVQEIKRIMTVIEISDEVIDEAKARGADLIVTHHPLIFGKIGSVDHNDVTGNYIIRLIGAGISVYSAHTSFDSALFGTNQYLAEGLGLAEIRPLAASDDEGCGMGREGVYAEEISFDDFMKRLTAVCDRNIYRIAGPRPERVGRVSLCTGAGAEFIRAAKENGSDVYVTGDVKYHDARTACEIGVCVVDAGHFGTENIFSGNFAGQLKARLAERGIEDVDIFAAESDLDPFRPYPEP